MAVIEQTITSKYALYNGDCCETLKSLPNGKVHLSIYSPPFGGLYHYSSNDRDLSNSSDYGELFKHYEFVVSELERVTMPGRITAVHATDIPSSNTGNDYLTDFPGEIIRLHERMGFHFIARHTIWKEPLWVRRRTMTHNLSHRTIIDDAAYGGVASGDYLLVFRKHGKNPVPIQHPTGFSAYAGECPIPSELDQFRNMEGDQKLNRFSHWIWRRYASSIWDDIRMGRVLPFQDCKDPEDEKHCHPLQLDVIDRCVSLRSNPGEVVLTPFMGVGSEVYSAVKMGRMGIGIELKPSYYRQAVKNVEHAKDNVDIEQKELAFDEE
ncbi:MAG: site-specific DNA-methyltransferase [Proteobacteria bacterium]|nr:site-specific DNA-methyltransferase [Pseudomonadota bacterium]